ncbi:MAG: histidine triad (HIT) family protein [Bacteroidia bacterium]|jgi:histidine triad (HIT) family protein
MASIFTKIVNGDIPCYKIAETNDFLAFLDVFPLRRGHTLVIPKKEVDYIFDLDDETFAALHIFSKIVSNAVRQAISCKRIGIAVIGLEVPHTHIHLVPIDSVSDIDFSQPKLKIDEKEMTEIAAKIRKYL